MHKHIPTLTYIYTYIHTYIHTYAYTHTRTYAAGNTKDILLL